MTLQPLERPLPSIVWELRTAWATRREVSLTLDERASYPRVRGRVAHVAASGVFVQIHDGRQRDLDDRGRRLGAVHVPTGLILAVHSPHFTEPAPDPIGVQTALEFENQLSIYDFIGDPE